METPSQEQPAAIAPRWQPVSAVERRVLGVLVEKAKTTPDAYPLSLNALVTGCNQKNNREPHMNLRPEQVEEAVDRLRQIAAVGEVQGSGRVPKYRHYLKDWLGVDGTELAVMAELLLRGPQTVGELRGRASRMAPIADLAALRPFVESLKQKNLLIELSPEGRGQVVTHALYGENDLEEQRRRFADGGHARETSSRDEEHSARQQATHARSSSRPSAPADEDLAALRGEIESLREEVAALRRAVDELQAARG
jgi:uncharacterized protein YceH (UPF0502 family)